MQHYIARDYSMQIDTGDDYPMLNPAYFIGILDFPFGEGDKYNTTKMPDDKIKTNSSRLSILVGL